MRWNCPHCEELVTAGIDFEFTKQAYVRCGKCGGMSMIHRSAALAGFVKARRIEEETKLAASQAITKERLRAETVPSRMIVMPVEPEMSAPTPPPFRGLPTDETAPPPTFAYPKPPAFLMRERPEPTFNLPEESTKPTRKNVAVWVAAALAITSGIYLYNQGKQALTLNDRIALKSNSGTAR